jgi:hypothetical protein
MTPDLMSLVPQKVRAELDACGLPWAVSWARGKGLHYIFLNKRLVAGMTTAPDEVEVAGLLAGVRRAIRRAKG